jgi:REP element-mobilizing transposase RayT
LWQSNYYEHIVRDEYELGRIREYVEYNRANWGQDKNNPNNWG